MPGLSLWALGHPVIHDSFLEALGPCPGLALLPRVAWGPSAFADYPPYVQTLLFSATSPHQALASIRADSFSGGPTSDAHPGTAPDPHPRTVWFPSKLKPAGSSPAGSLDRRVLVAYLPARQHAPSQHPQAWLTICNINYYNLLNLEK